MVAEQVKNDAENQKKLEQQQIAEQAQIDAEIYKTEKLTRMLKKKP